MPKKKKTPYVMCEEMAQSELGQKWKEKGFDDQDIFDLFKQFKAVAKDRKPTKAQEKAGISGGGDDFVTKEEFVKQFTKKTKVAVKDAKQLFVYADTNKDGVLNIDEFICMMAIIKKDTPENKIKLAFQMFDTGSDGKLNDTEIKAMLELMLTIEDEAEKHNEIDQILTAILKKHDSDNDKKINLDELTAAMRDAKILDQFVGQNVKFDGASKALLDTALKKEKSAVCSVM